jgi:hypothetical protein
MTPSEQCDCRAVVLDSGHCDSCGRLVIQQSQPERSFSEALGGWMASDADNVRDMGRRVDEVLTDNPRDHHYAGSKMAAALGSAVSVMTYAGYSEDEMLELLRDAHERALRNMRDLHRELAANDVPPGDLRAPGAVDMLVRDTPANRAEIRWPDGSDGGRRDPESRS